MSNNQLYNQLLQTVLAERPELAQYAELFTAQDSSEDSDDKELKLRLRKITVLAKRLKQDLDDALGDLDDLAQALGACEECWGRDNRCPTCRGEGSPGYFKSDKVLFEELIRPALSKATWLEVQEK
jgi:hypothetical protein